MNETLPVSVRAAPLLLSSAAGSAALSQAPSRAVPAECAVAISYNGTAQAVMMATPADLADFARGFTLTEGLAAPEDIERIEILLRRPGDELDESGGPAEDASTGVAENVEQSRDPTTAATDVSAACSIGTDPGLVGTSARTIDAEGVELSIWLRPEAGARLAERRRSRAGPVGCGLCGIEELAEALRAPPPVTSRLKVNGVEILQATEALRAHQPLHDLTRAVHAAGFWQPGKGIVMAREDVGRHNALDKLIGGLLAANLAGGSGAVVLTSRVSVDMVQKVARLGAPLLIAVSAPTRAALNLADATRITVVALARAGSAEVFTHPERIVLSPADKTSDAPRQAEPAERQL